MTFFFAGVWLFGAAAAALLVVRRPRIRDGLMLALVTAGSLALTVPSVRVLAGAPALTEAYASAMPGGAWVMGIDALSATFLLVIAVVGASCAAYGVAYVRADARPARAAWSHAGIAVLIAAMALVVTAQSVVAFLVAWELMAISSFALIMADHEHAEVRRAGLLYLVMTHAATLSLYVAFAVWSRDATDWTFASLAARGLPTGWAGVATLTCAAIGFGIKAGLVPAHFWLPPAHAAAPSHVSAIMSALVIKIGIYGLLRVAMLAGVLPVWWGWALLVVGVVSALLGVLWALAQHDIKRLLAFHSVENVGIIAMGLGVGALGVSYGLPGLAVLGYGAALLHTANHALFKALLFLCAGAIQRSTGTRNLELLGGLARRMPVTWAAFAVGAVAIVGLPPLNGFVSEWLLFLGLFGAGTSHSGMRLAILAAPALAVVGGLALACFTKVAGVVFLGRARSAAGADAHEAQPGLVVPALVLAGACVLIGLGAAVVVPPVLAAAASVTGLPNAARDPAVSGALRGATFVTGLALLLVIVGGAAWLGGRRLIGRVPVRRGPTWGCAFPVQTPRVQYTASSFAAPLIRMFGALAGVTAHRGATVFHSTPRDLVLDDVADPAWRLVQRWALRLRPLQRGRLNVYLAYVVVTLLVLLGYVALIAPVSLP